jgi:hypothetical protein
MHMLKTGALWRDCPAEYGPYTTIYNRFNRWSRQGVWEDIFYALTASTGLVGGVTASIDSMHIKAHRSAGGAKRGELAQAIGRSRDVLPQDGRRFHTAASLRGRHTRLRSCFLLSFDGAAHHSGRRRLCDMVRRRDCPCHRHCVNRLRPEARRMGADRDRFHPVGDDHAQYAVPGERIARLSASGGQGCRHFRASDHRLDIGDRHGEECT